MSNRRHHQLIQFIPGIALLMAVCVPLTTFADCKTSYDQSVGMLDSQLEKANNQAHPDADEFEMSFTNSVNRLKSEKCLPELMRLIQHIQGEQQKYPRLDKNAKPTPIKE